MRGGRFTLLNFGLAIMVEAFPTDFRTLHAVEQPTGPDEIACSEDRLASAYGAADRSLVLIRPTATSG